MKTLRNLINETRSNEELLKAGLNQKTLDLLNNGKNRDDIIKAFEEIRGEKITMNSYWENATIGQLLDDYNYEVQYYNK